MVDFKQGPRHYRRNTCPAMPSCPPISTGRRKKASGRGLLILVFVIGVGIFGNDKAAYAIPSGGKWLKDAIEGRSLDPANFVRSSIRIFDFPEANETTCSLSDAIYLSLIEGAPRYLLKPDCKSETTRFSDLIALQIRGLKIIWQSILGINNFKFDTEREYFGKSVPDIDNQNVYNNRFIRGERSHNPDIFQSNFGAVGSVEFSPRQFNSFVGGSQHSIGSPPQSSSEQRQKNSKDCSDKPFIFVSNVRNPSEADEDGSVEGGAFFFGFLGICCMAACIGYWIAGQQR